MGIFALLFLISILYRGRNNRISPAFSTFIVKLVVCVCGQLLLIESGLFGTFLVLALLVLFCLPTLVLDWVVVPLGLPRMAYWIVKLCRPLNFAGKNDSGCALYAALALTRRGASTETLEWLAAYVPNLPEQKGIGTVAAGLLAALNGNLLLARHLLKMANNLPANALPKKFRIIARDWLIADAAQAADWKKVIDWGRQQRGGRWSYAVARIAERLTGQNRAYKNWQLWGLWLLAPRRGLLLPLLRRAIAIPRNKPANDMSLPAMPQEPGHLAEALATCVPLLEQCRQVTGATPGIGWVNSAIRHVDMQLDHPLTHQQIAQRLHILGASTDHAPVIQNFRQKLVTLIIPLIEVVPNLAAGSIASPSLQQAITIVRSRMFQDIEVRCADYAQRTQVRNFLNIQAEWQAWTVLCDIAERLLLLDPAAEEALFQTMFVPLCNFAVDQHNQVKRLQLAHDIFTWLHAHSFSHPDARVLLAKNKDAT